ncbi:hypothetical protein SOVF_026470 [Spinacia oleracea]|nr:hypothetical protein SOVF_026470 [Spinacia oleracea]
MTWLSHPIGFHVRFFHLACAPNHKPVVYKLGGLFGLLYCICIPEVCS